jgi:uncharacterized protein
MSTEPLCQHLKSLEGGVGVAFSGGVDSTYLLRMAGDKCSGPVMPILMVSPFLTRRESLWAKGLARYMKMGLKTVDWDPLQLPDITRNTEDRCYHCKHAMYHRILAECRQQGLSHLADGTQEDDLNSDRPGLRAIAELSIETPLAASHIGKQGVRTQSAILALPTWNRPSQSCLATRIPFGTPLTTDLLRKVEHGEDFLQDLGIWPCRLMIRGHGIRLRVAQGDKVVVKRNWGRVREYVKMLGFNMLSLSNTPILVR